MCGSAVSTPGSRPRNLGANQGTWESNNQGSWEQICKSLPLFVARRQFTTFLDNALGAENFCIFVLGAEAAFFWAWFLHPLYRRQRCTQWHFFQHITNNPFSNNQWLWSRLHKILDGKHNLPLQRMFPSHPHHRPLHLLWLARPWEIFRARSFCEKGCSGYKIAFASCCVRDGKSPQRK